MSKVLAYCGDCARIPLDDNSVDLVVTSPPYEKRNRRYDGLNFELEGEAWVEWAVPRFEECLRVCRGLVAWVVGSKIRNGRWSAVPALLQADLHRRGVMLRSPAFFVRQGTPGSGGPQWLRNDAEFIVCASKGRLPWSDNTAFGKAPKPGPKSEIWVRKPYTDRAEQASWQRWGNSRASRRRQRAGDLSPPTMPKRVNPGNLIALGRADSWGMGSKFAQQTEAPFPEWLARFFIVSFCRPGGTVLDPMCGSGTVASVAAREGRNAILGDLRRSQIKLSRERVLEETKAAFDMHRRV